MLLDFNEDKWSDLVVENCLKEGDIEVNEEEIVDWAYDMIERWQMENGLLTELFEISVEKLLKKNIKVLK